MKQRTFFTFFMICITSFNNSFSQEWFKKGKKILYPYSQNIYKTLKGFNYQQLSRFLSYYAKGRSAIAIAALATSSPLVKEKLQQVQQATIQKASKKVINYSISTLDEASKASKKRIQEIENQSKSQREKQKEQNELELKASEERNLKAKQEREERANKEERIRALQLNYEKKKTLKEDKIRQKEKLEYEQKQDLALQKAIKRNNQRRQKERIFQQKTSKEL